MAGATSSDAGVRVRVVTTTQALLHDDINSYGSAVPVQLEAGRVLTPKSVTWLMTGMLLVEMHHSLTLSIAGRDVVLERQGHEQATV